MKKGPKLITYAGKKLVRVSDKTMEVKGHNWATYTPEDDEMHDAIFEYCIDCKRILQTR